MENFEKATRAKLRFSTNKGQLSVEDLWELSLTSLDNIARAVNRELKSESEESFITNKTATNTVLELKLDILKHIIGVKLAERDATKARSERQAKLAELKTLAASKALEVLGSKSLDEINKMIADLEKEE